MKYHVKDYIRTGMTDSEAVRAVLAASAADTERTIIFDGRDFQLSEAVILPSDTTVIVDDCTIRQEDYTFDNIFRGGNLDFDPQDPYGYAVNVRPLKNIRILGRGKAALTGPEKNRTTQSHPACDVGHSVMKLHMEMTGDYWGWRSHQLHFDNCTNLEISGFSISRTRGWAVTFSFCSQVLIHDICFDTHVKNGDGINFRAGCHNCEAWNITGFTSDDTVACTALCNISPEKYDTPEAGEIKLPMIYPAEPARLILGKNDLRAMDIHDIKIHDLKVSGVYHAVICLAAGGLQVYNISISNIEETSERNWTLVDIYTGYGTGYSKGDLHDISIKNIIAKSNNLRDVPKAGVAVRTGVENISIENVVQHGTGPRIYVTEPDGIIVDGKIHDNTTENQGTRN